MFSSAITIESGVSHLTLSHDDLYNDDYQDLFQIMVEQIELTKVVIDLARVGVITTQALERLHFLITLLRLRGCAVVVCNFDVNNILLAINFEAKLDACFALGFDHAITQF